MTFKQTWPNPYYVECQSGEVTPAICKERAVGIVDIGARFALRACQKHMEEACLHRNGIAFGQELVMVTPYPEQIAELVALQLAVSQGDDPEDYPSQLAARAAQDVLEHLSIVASMIDDSIERYKVHLIRRLNGEGMGEDDFDFGDDPEPSPKENAPSTEDE